MVSSTYFGLLLGSLPWMIRRVILATAQTRVGIYEALGHRKWARQIRHQAFLECLTCSIHRLSNRHLVPVDALTVAQRVWTTVPRTVANLQSCKHILLEKLKTQFPGIGELELLDIFCRCNLALAEESPADASLMEAYGRNVANTDSTNAFLRGGTVLETASLPIK